MAKVFISISSRSPDNMTFIDDTIVNGLSLRASGGTTDQLSIPDSLLLLLNKYPEKLIVRPTCFGCAEMQSVGKTIFCGLALFAYLRELDCSKKDARAIVDSGSTNVGGRVNRNEMAECWFDEIE